MKIEVMIGEIARLADAQALINSDNARMRFGPGIAGEIHTAAGPALEAFCAPLAPLGLSAAVITPSFQLAPHPWGVDVRAPHYLHDDELKTHYACAIRSMMDVLHAHRIESVAVPAIGAGVFRFPLVLVASIMARVVRESVLYGSARCASAS
ncbi:MAG: macro domain-containing protein [Gammaproteobacteria bacterium]|nr:macro domain-containing protein [Gammaproteobacteria bacterium]MBU1441482.1 macro domain-containing protein [Gammaproteobacteria bacterium]MBU2410524.1 macro domain-containing protein [Gammaproteobacteria bacterium]